MSNVYLKDFQKSTLRRLAKLGYEITGGGEVAVDGKWTLTTTLYNVSRIDYSEESRMMTMDEICSEILGI